MFLSSEAIELLISFKYNNIKINRDRGQASCYSKDPSSILQCAPDCGPPFSSPSASFGVG